MTGKIHDTRYRNVSLTISEYDIQYTSGVDRKIHNKPLFEKYFTPNVEQAKRNIDYTFWGRPTIPWKLECEALNSTSRSDIVNLFTNGADSHTESQENLYLCEVWACAMAVFGLFTVFFGNLAVRMILSQNIGGTFMMIFLLGV